MESKKVAKKAYAGIGSRETPREILELMTQLASKLESMNYILRSGGADGADTAFELGVKYDKNKEIFLPWRGFNGSKSKLYNVSPEVEKVAAVFHPRWAGLKQGAKKLHARNVCQVLGADLKSKSLFVVCWTKNGEGTGGTGQAIRIAESYGIPIYDMGKESVRLKIETFLTQP